MLNAFFQLVHKVSRWMIPMGMLISLCSASSGFTIASAGPFHQSKSKQNNLLGISNEFEMIQTDQVIIKFKDSHMGGFSFDPTGAQPIPGISEAAGVSLVYSHRMSNDAHVLRLPARLSLQEVNDIVGRLRELPNIEYAEPDLILQHTLTPNDPLFSSQWHYSSPSSGSYGINAPAAWDIFTGSASIVVAVIDTGITNHAEFVGRTVPGYDFISDIPTANDGDGRDSDPGDPGDWVLKNECGPGTSAQNSSWHGTHTSGTIGAVSNNGIGVTGIDWSSKILPVRVLGKCGGYTSDIVDAMRWAAGESVTGVPTNNYPAKVINISLGGTGLCGTSFQTAIDSITSAGITVVVAAGNNNVNANLFSPANCNGVITVAATNRNGNKAYYSNYGAIVEISAPGGDSLGYILSTFNTGTQGPVADGYAYYQGTSMAAPHVSGVASLLYSLKPSLTPSQVLAYLQSTSTSFPSGSTCTTSTCGSGIVNAGAAVAALFPTAVDLISFSAAAANNSIVLTWKTANEVDNLGFNLYRSESFDERRTQINSEMIASKAPGSLSGSPYAFVDDTVEMGISYYYWLEDVDIFGNAHFYGPIFTHVPVDLTDVFSIFMPTVWGSN